MKIGFFCVYRGDPIHYVLADIMIRSAKQCMPGVEIVQLTDDPSPQVVGADSVLRRQSVQMATLRAEHQAECQGDWLFVDTDIVFQRDVRHVFDDKDFDVAVADRVWPEDVTGNAESKMAEIMPWNAGVVFCRQPAFFQAVKAMMAVMPLDKCAWMGDQFAVGYAVRSGAFRAKILPGLTYNYPPRKDDPLERDAFILHYKGSRKAQMLRRIGPMGAARSEPPPGLNGPGPPEPVLSPAEGAVVQA